jgi:hypothetical protein
MLRHLLNPSSSASRENNHNSSATHNEKAMDNDHHPPQTQQQHPRKTIQVWLCDVCSQQFRDFDEACRHEEKCRQEKQSETPEPDNNKPPPASQPDEFKVESNSIMKSSTTDSNTPPDESHLSSSQKEQSASKPIVSPKPDSSSLTAVVVGRPKRRAASRPKKFKDGIDTSSLEAQASEPKKKKCQLKQAKIQPLAHAASKKTKPSSKTAKKAPIASIFAKPEEQKAALAEHRAAEFMAKRRADAQRERERQQRRLQAKQQLEDTTISKPAEDKSQPVVPANKAELLPAAVRFPAMSHVGAEASSCVSFSGKVGTAWVSPDDLNVARANLVHNARYPMGGQTLSESNEVPRLLQSQNDTLREITESDPLQTILSSVLLPPETRSSHDTSTMSLWCDKYGIQKVPEDVCGDDNKRVAEQMLNFVEDWKVERRKAHDRRAERQKALLKSKKRKRKEAYAEDLWEDSEDDEFGLCNVCLITGPPGSGKTALVHAVAKQSDCLVLEINTAEKRSGAALKHTIEEATQSDSSLDMLKKTGSLQDATDLVDTDDEMEESGQGSAVVVILIDEGRLWVWPLEVAVAEFTHFAPCRPVLLTVDNIYEDEGDNGFWAALNTVAKRAKCPIYLTANSVPSNLRSIRYRLLEVSRPSPVECTSHILRIVKGEEFSLRRDLSDVTKTRLTDVAKLCGCDLRRVANELQLFATSRTKNSDTSEQDDLAALEQVSEKCLHLAPVIAQVHPKAVRHSEVTVLMIKGEHFLRLAEEDLSCEVLIGDQRSPLVQIMDDSTIFAACPPCSLPSNVNDVCVYTDTYHQCYTSRYAPLTVRAKARRGILSTTEGTVRSDKLFTGEVISFSMPPINVEYGFPPPRYDLMHALEDPSPFKVVDSGIQETHLPADVMDRQAKALMKDAVDQWRSSLPVGIPTAPLTVTSRAQSDRDSPGKTMKGLASHYARLSDAAHLDDSVSQALPHLAGCVLGFRSDLVDDSSATRQSDQSKKKANT